MDNIFNLHFDMSGSSGDPMSSRHMNRSQARQVFRESLINNVIIQRNDGVINPDILKDIVENERRLGHKFHFCLPVDDDFKGLLCYSGSFYWCLAFELCLISSNLYGIEAIPDKSHPILLDSVIFYSKKQDVTYRILNVFDVFEPSYTILTENARLVDELDINYGILDALVDGYMWGQSQEARYEQIYFNDLVQAPVIWSDISQAHFAWERKQFETDIMPGGSVSLKARY